MAGEIVLCFEAGAVRDMLPHDGFTPCQDADCLRQLLPWFAPRQSVEEWSAFRQLIPYVVLTKGGRICIYRRTRKGGEKRLHDRWSIGFGGHIQLADVVVERGAIDLGATIRRAADREVQEEFGQVSLCNRQMVGVILDDSDDVGRVHMGLVEVWGIDSVIDQGCENKQDQIQFVSIEKMGEVEGKMERWSQLCVAAIVQRCSSGAPESGTVNDWQMDSSR